MSRLGNVVAGLTLGALLLSPKVKAQTEADTLRGQVTNVSSIGLDSTRVIVDGVWSDTTFTDVNGFYEATGVRPGTPLESSPTGEQLRLESVYPNPSSQRFNACLNHAPLEGLEGVVTNVVGQKLQSFDWPAGRQCHVVDMERYPDGFYLLQVVGDDGFEVRKLTKLASFPVGPSGDVQPAPVVSARSGFANDFEVSFDRVGYEDLVVPVTIPGTDELDVTLEYGNNSQDITVTDPNGGLLDEALVEYFSKIDQSPITSGTTNDGSLTLNAQFYGPAEAMVSHPSVEDSVFDTFFGSSNATFVAESILPFGHQYLVSDFAGDPLEGVVLDGQCLVNGIPYSFDAITDSDGIASIDLSFGNLRGGEFEAECAGTASKPTYFNEDFSGVIIAGSSSELSLDRLGLVELYAVPLLNHFGSVGPGFMDIGGQQVFDVDGTLLPDGRVPLDPDGAARFYVTQGEFTVDPLTANHNGGFVVWNRPPGVIDHYADGREGHRMYDKIVRVGGPGTNASKILTAYIANDDWQAAEDGMAEFLFRQSGTPWQNFPLRCFNIYENGLPFAVIPTEDVDGTVYVPLPGNVESASQGLDSLAVLYESRTNAITNVREVPISQYGDQVIGITAFDLAPPGQNSADIDPSTGLILRPKWFSAFDGLSPPHAALDEILDAAIIGGDLGEIMTTPGPNGELIIFEKVENHIIAAYTFGCMQNAYDG